MAKTSLIKAFWLGAIVATSSSALAKVPYFEGFEDPGFTTGTDWNNYGSTIARVPSGTDGVLSRSGAFHASISSPGPSSGVFSRLGAYSSDFSSGYSVSQCVYIDINDPAVASGTYGWDCSVASNGATGSHLRDFIFHVATNPLNQVVIGASNNSTGSPQVTPSSVPLSSSGWYQMLWKFHDVGTGSLAVEMCLYDSSGTLVFSETRNSTSDVIHSSVGGNRYLWFTFIQASHLAIDNAMTDYRWDDASPVDLSGVYRTPNNGVAIASSSSSSNRVAASSHSGSSLQENTFTPFSDSLKAPASLVIDIDDLEAFSFEVDMGAVTDYADRGDFVRIGLGQEDIASALSSGVPVSSLALAVYRDGSDFRWVGTESCDDDEDLLASSVVLPGATQFRVCYTVNSGIGWTECKITPLDGPDAGVSAVTLSSAFSPAPWMDTCVMFSSVSSPPSVGARMAIGSRGAPAVKEVKKSTKSSRAPALQISFLDPYQQPSQLAVGKVSMSDLHFAVGGYQAYLHKTDHSGSSSFSTGSYSSQPFSSSSAHFYGPPDSSLRLAGGIPPNQALSVCNFALASLSFSGVDGTCMSLEVLLSNGQGLDTMFSDDLGTAILPDRLSSNVVLFDGAPPSCAVSSATQGSVDLTSPTSVLMSGPVEVLFSSSDAHSGLEFLSATLDISPPGDGPEDIPMSVSHQELSVFGATCDVPSSTSNGPVTLKIRARDRAGNALVTELQLPVLNTASVSLTIQMPGAAVGSSVVRGMEITFAKIGGPTLDLSQDVILVDGSAVLVFTAAHGLPTLSIGDTIEMSVKDPLHTLRKKTAPQPVVSEGNQATFMVMLRGGNLNKDHRVDIGDYVVYAVRYGVPVSPDTPFSLHTPTFRHADIDGDGDVDSGDFSYISAHFGTHFDEALAGTGPRVDPRIRTRISVRDAIIEAGNDKRAGLMDLNRDGWITVQEIQTYLQGPQP